MAKEVEDSQLLSRNRGMTVEWTRTQVKQVSEISDTDWKEVKSETFEYFQQQEYGSLRNHYFDFSW